MAAFDEALARASGPCPATLEVAGTTVACDIQHDARSRSPEESPHQRDLGNWQIRWKDWSCGHTVADPSAWEGTEGG